MIRGVTGFPRNGKTLLVVIKMCDELIYSERSVACNMSDGELKLGRLNEYCQELMELRKQKLTKTINLDERLIIIPKEKSFQYYRHRSGGLILPEPPESNIPLQEWYVLMKKFFLPLLERPEFGVPVSYFLTEAHDYFPAKDWQQIGRPTKFYASKHAHLHDENIIETQFPMQLDANFRNLIQEWHRMTNNSLLSFGPFQKPNNFQRDVFRGVPPAVGGFPIETAKFKIDVKGVASCYETTGSLGIMGRGPESKGFNHKRKMPWFMIYVFGAAAAIAIACVAMFVPRLIGKALSGLVGGVNSGMQGALDPASVKTAKTDKPAIAARSVATPAAKRLDVTVEDEYAEVVGVMVREDAVLVAVRDRGWLQTVGNAGREGILLSDGSIVRRRDVVAGRSAKTVRVEPTLTNDRS